MRMRQPPPKGRKQIAMSRWQFAPGLHCWFWYDSLVTPTHLLPRVGQLIGFSLIHPLSRPYLPYLLITQGRGRV